MHKIYNFNFLRLALLGFFLLLPFLFNSVNFESPFELFKLSAATFYLIPVFILFIFVLLEKDKVFIRWNLGLSLASLIVISNLLSYAVSVNPYLSFWGDNLLPSESLRSVVLFFSFAVMVSQTVVNADSLKTYIKVLYAVVTISVLHGILQIFGYDPTWISVYKAVCGTLGNTSAYASLLGSLAPILMAVIFTSDKKFAKYFTIFLLVLLNYCMFYTSARVPLVVNFVITICFLIFCFKRKNYLSFFKDLSIVFLLILATFVFFKYTTNATAVLENKMKSIYVTKSIDMRRILATNGYEAWREKPLLGYGPETFSIAQRPKQSLEMNKYQAWSGGWVKAHNHLVQTLVCTGLFGLLVHLFLFGCVSFYFFKLFLKKNREKNDILTASFYFGYLFLFVSNLTSFDFIATQLYTAIFPVLFFIGIGKVTNFEFTLQRRLRGLIIIFSIISLLCFLINSYNYWTADVEFQKINYSTELKNNIVEAIKQSDKAIEKNEYEPVYYCYKAVLIENFLNTKKTTIVENVKNIALDEIDKNTKKCINLSVNRDRFLDMKASVYGLLYVDGIIADPSVSLESYELLRKMTPVSPLPVLRIGILYFRQGLVEKFKENMLLAIQLKNDYIPAYIELVNFYYKEHDLAKVHALAEEMSRIVFFASEQTEYLKDLPIIALQNKDEEGEKMFRELADKYKNFKDIN
jgi:hypothetical protein